MAPRNPPTSRATGSTVADSADSGSITLTDAQEALQAAQAEIERLQAQLEAQNLREQSLGGPELVTVLEGLAR